MGFLFKLLAVFHPKIEGYAAYNYYCINNFKTCHCSPSFLSKLRAMQKFWNKPGGSGNLTGFMPFFLIINKCKNDNAYDKNYQEKCVHITHD